jgi:hypothetical protein
MRRSQSKTTYETTTNTIATTFTTTSNGRRIFSGLLFVVSVVIVVGVVVKAVPAAAAADINDGSIVIRTYDAAGVGSDRAAIAVADSILEAAGVAVTWVSCDGVFVRAGDDPCVGPIEPATLAVRFVRELPHDRTGTRDGAVNVALGDSLVDTRLRAGALATIYMDRVSALAATCGVEEPTLLGRAIAHEVGHLLMGTSNHADTGLMRAAWTQDALRRRHPREWLFTPRDARSMRDAVRVRTARQIAAVRTGE